MNIFYTWECIHKTIRMFSWKETKLKRKLQLISSVFYSRAKLCKLCKVESVSLICIGADSRKIIVLLWVKNFLMIWLNYLENVGNSHSKLVLWLEFSWFPFCNTFILRIIYIVDLGLSIWWWELDLNMESCFL